MYLYWMTTSRLFYSLVLFSLNFCFIYAAQTKKCGNEACDEILFQGKVHRDQPYSHPNFLSYKIGDVIKVYAIELNDRVDLWDGELEDGTRGLFYKSHIDHDDYVLFLEKSIAENRDLYVMERERKFGSPVTKESAVEVLSKVWQIVQENLRAKSGGNEQQPPPAKQAEPVKNSHTAIPASANQPPPPPPSNAASTEQPSVKTVKQQQQQPAADPSTNQPVPTPQPPAVSATAASTTEHPTTTTTTTTKSAQPTVSTPQSVAKNQQQPAVTPVNQPVEADSKDIEDKNLNTPSPSPQSQVDAVDNNATPPPSGLPQENDSKSSDKVESDKSTKEHSSVEPAITPATSPPSVPAKPDVVAQSPTPILSSSVSDSDSVNTTPSPSTAPPQPSTTLHSLLKHEHHHHHHHHHGHGHSHEHDHGHGHSHGGQSAHSSPPAEKSAEPTVRVKESPIDLQTTASTNDKPAEVSSVETVTSASNDTTTDDSSVEPASHNQSVVLEMPTETSGSIEGLGIQNLHITQNTIPPIKDTVDPSQSVDRHSHGIEENAADEHRLPQSALSDVSRDLPNTNHAVNDTIEELQKSEGDELQTKFKIGTEIKNELGDEYCIKEDCTSNTNLHNTKSTNKDEPHDSHDHSHEPHDHGHNHEPHDHGHSSEPHSHSHSHNHHDSHGHSHEHHGHGHSHVHQASVTEQMADAVKTGKTYAVWIKQNLKPIVAGFRFLLKPPLRLVPREFRDWIGEREIFMIMIISLTLVVHFVTWALDSGRQRKSMVGLCKYAELYEKFKTLETENDKLKKTTFDSDKFAIEIQKERDLSNSKIVELQTLKDENSSLKESNAFLDEEITRLKEKLLNTGQHEKDLKNLQKKIDELRQLNEDLERQSKEFRQSFEREREKCENLDAKLTAEHEIVKKLQEETSKLRHESKDSSKKIEKYQKEHENLETELRERTKELEGLKLLMANMEQASSVETTVTDGAATTGSDSNGTTAKDWDWGDSGSDEETKKRNFEHKMAEIVNAAKLQSQLQERSEEIEQLKRVMKDMLADKEAAEKQSETLKTENETLQKSLKDAEEKTLTLQSKITVLRDFYEDQRKEMSKQLVQQQVTSQKQSNDLGSFEEDMKRLREENAVLRKTDEDLRAEVKNLDNLLSKARNELDRSRHEAWTTVRRLEREKDSMKSENSMLRTRLTVDRQQPTNLASPAGSGGAGGGTAPGDVSNNSSEAELGQISAAARSPPPLPAMPSYPPPCPPNAYSGHTSPFYPPPMPYFPPPRDEYDYGGYYSPAESPRDEYPPRDFPSNEMRRSYRRPKSKTRSSPSRSPSPRGGGGHSNHSNKERDKRARSRGGGAGSGREPSVSPPPHPRRRNRSRPRSPPGGAYPPYGYIYPIDKR